MVIAKGAALRPLSALGRRTRDPGLPSSNPDRRKRWIAGSKPLGTLTVDDGPPPCPRAPACCAGVVAVEGDFGAAIRVLVCPARRKGGRRGLSAYSSAVRAQSPNTKPRDQAILGYREARRGDAPR
jgi:glutamate 5-kinase